MGHRSQGDPGAVGLWYQRRPGIDPPSPVGDLTYAGAHDEVVADAKHGTTLNHLHIGEAGVSAFIPTTCFGNQHTGIWGREHFQRLPDEDVFLLSCRPASAALPQHDRNPAHPLRLRLVSLSP